MSKRFLRWIDVWIEDNVRPGSGGDVEAYDVRAARIAKELIAEAERQGFRKAEIDEEAGKVAGLIEKKLSTKPEFDISAFGAAPED
jgi:protein subunit release factor B